MNKGHLHLVTQISRQVVEIFSRIGFKIVEGPYIETEWYNFDALNMPDDHPARDMQDTFHIANEKSKLLRTQTSALQVRFMEKNQPPFKIICPGKVFRRDATDPSHSPEFYQLEGLVVSKEASLAELKGVLETFLKELFGQDTIIRWRPGYFPFVEPGMEVDIQCAICHGKGCPTCKRKGWVELLGAGTVHPNVFNAAGYNSDEWQGYAFGVGIDRLAMMKFNISDIRVLYSGDLRFLKQF
jgi:phenylalanyl-tRNA synthetase alpha chain